jgi:hypothetical protein
MLEFPERMSGDKAEIRIGMLERRDAVLERFEPILSWCPTYVGGNGSGNFLIRRQRFHIQTQILPPGERSSVRMAAHDLWKSKERISNLESPESLAVLEIFRKKDLAPRLDCG